MRVWDIPVQYLCDDHLRGQHREIHAIWSVIINNKKGYANHPETNRWRGHLDWLWWEHLATSQEMINRGMNHDSPLAKPDASSLCPSLIMSIPEQISRLREKGCSCDVGRYTEFIKAYGGTLKLIGEFL